MTRLALYGLLLILAIGLAGALDATKHDAREYNNILTIEGGDAITITTEEDTDEAVIHVDGEEATRKDKLTTGTPNTIEAGPGTHNVTVRYLKTYEYEWDRPDITKNDQPLELEYVEHDEDDKRLQFNLHKARPIHPNQLDTLEESRYEELETYEATLNGHKELECYPKVTTSKAGIYFSCRTSEYPKTLELEVTVGVEEQATVTIEDTTTEEETREEQNTPATPPTPPQPPKQQEENTTILDDIELQDTYGGTEAGIPVPAFFGILGITILTLLYIVSHHNHHSKQSGTHHKVKRKK
ncbi:MAG: hypothetical protein ACLFO2_01565 [Candidatus Woesearchaeota archaeon]